MSSVKFPVSRMFFVALLLVLAGTGSLLAQSPFLAGIGPNYAVVGQTQSITLVGVNLNNGGGTPQVCYNPAGSEGSCDVALSNVTVVSSGHLTATFPSTATPQNGTIFIRPTTGGEIGYASFQVVAAGTTPLPRITSMSRTSAVIGSYQVTFNLTGSGFTAPPAAEFVEAEYITPFGGVFSIGTQINSDTSVTVTIPGYLARLGLGFIRYNSNGRYSNLVGFTFNNPSITSMSRNTAVINTGPITVTLNGSFPDPGPYGPEGFVAFTKPGGSEPSSISLTTQTATQVVFSIPNNLLDTLGAASLYYGVFYTEGSPAISNSQTFTILPPPAITQITPSSAVAGSGNTPIVITGTGLTNGGAPVVTWTVGQTVNQLTVNSAFATTINATIPSSLLTAAGTASIAVVSGAPSNSVPFTIHPAPTTSFMSPTSAFAGSGQTTVSIGGADFLTGGSPTVRWTPAGGSAQTLTPVSATATLITVNIPASLLLTAGTASVQVVKGGVASNARTFTIYPSPVISTLSPPNVPPGNPSFPLTITGQNLVSAGPYEIRVNFGATRLQPSSVTNTQAIVTIPASLVTTPGQIPVSVAALARGPGRDLPQVGPISNTLTFTVLGPLNLTTLNPTFAQAGAGNTQLVVTGTAFNNGSVVRFGGTDLATTFNSTTQLTATITAALLATAGTRDVTVRDTFGRISNALPFQILTPLQVTSTSPAFREAGSGNFPITINGTGFDANTIARFNGTDLATTLVSSSQVTATVPGSLIPTVGAFPVSVRDNRGRTSNSVTFNVVTPLQLTSLAPIRGNAGIPAFTLVVNGQGFTQGAVVRFNGANLTSTLISSLSLTAVVPPNLVAAAGPAEVRVQLTDGRLSGPLTFTVLPQLLITSLNPPLAPANGNSVDVIVNGQGFTEESVVRFGGLNLSTQFLSETQLRTRVTDTLLGDGRGGEITVANPLNAVSNALPFGAAAGNLTITTLNPNSAPVNSPATPILVTGTGFTTGTVIRFGGVDIPTTVNSPTQLAGTIPAQLLITPGKIPVVAANGALVSNALTFEVGNRPEITFLNPGAITAGAARFSLIVLGRNFLPGSVIKFGDQDLVTTFAGAAQLSGVVPAELLTTPRSVAVTVTNPDGQTSNSETFRIVNLTLTSLEPDRIAANSAAFTMSLTGTGFIQGATVSFGGTSLITIFGSATGLTASVPASALVSPGEVQVTVTNPDGARSNAVRFIIVGDDPTITRLNPNSVVAGSGEVTVNVIGSGYVRGSSVSANGQSLATTFGSATSLDAVVPASMTQAIGRLNFRVTNPGNRESNESAFNVTAPTPAITSINPPRANAGVTTDVTITVTGTGFVNGSSVQFNGSGLATEFGSATSLTAVIPFASLATPGAAQIRVSNPGNILSNTVQFQIVGVLEVTAVSPSTIVGGGTTNVTIGVSGVGFVNGSVVNFGGNALATTFNGAGSLSAILTPANLATPGSFAISVSNPNGQTSNSVSLQIDAPIPPPPVNLQVPAVITPAGTGRVQVVLDGPAPVALTGTLVLTFTNNSNNAPAGYVDPALVFAGTGNRIITFSIPQGGTTASLLADGAFSPGTVAGTIIVTMTQLTGGGQNLLPNPAPVRNIVVDRAPPVIVPGSVRITNVTGGLQVELAGISSVRDLLRIAYTFSSGVNILEGSTITVDVTQLFTAFFASDPGRSSGGSFRFTMPFTISGGDAASVTSVSVTLTNSVGSSTPVSGGR
jgi:hypothetical protein